MSQKAWMQAYTKGSKSLQARLAKLHANNPEFQEFVKKHGFGGNLSAKQAEKQKKTSIGVQQTEKNAPTKGPVDREAMIRAAAEKLRDRKLASANRAAFGGELGGGFSIPNMSFRTYREARELSDSDRAEIEYSNELKREKAQNELRKHRDEVRRKMKKGSTYTPKKWVKEDIEYKGGDKLRMRKGGWIVVRDGKQHGIIHPTEERAKMFADATRETLGRKVMKALRMKVKGIVQARYATESAANRRRIRSWDSAIMPELRPLTVKPKSKVPFDEDPPKKNPGIVVGKNDPGYSRARHLARLGLKKAMEKSNV